MGKVLRGFCRFALQTAVLVSLLLFAVPAMAHETDELLDQPGFRPDSAHAAAFVAALDSATIAVHPAIVRRSERTAHSFETRSEAIALLEAAGVSASRGNVRADLGRLFGSSQWGLF